MRACTATISAWAALGVAAQISGGRGGSARFIDGGIQPRRLSRKPLSQGGAERLLRWITPGTYSRIPFGSPLVDVAKARSPHPTYDPPVPPVVAVGPSWNGATTIASLVLSTIVITSCRSGWGTANLSRA